MRHLKAGRKFGRTSAHRKALFRNLPKTKGSCDSCGGKLEQRPDDNSETIQERLKVYEKSTAPLKMTIVSPYLARLKKEGEQGQKKITQYTRYGKSLRWRRSPLIWGWEKRCKTLN